MTEPGGAMPDQGVPAERSAGDDMTIGLGGLRFDPAAAPKRRGRRGPPRPAAATDEPDPADTRIVQFHRPLSVADVTRLREGYGLALTAYVPNLAYVERVEATTRRRLARDPLVRAVIPYLPEYKVSPAIGRAPPPATQDAAAGAVRLDATLFDGGSLPYVVSVLEDLGATDIMAVDDRSIGGFPRVRFALEDLRAVGQLARLDDVRWIEPAARIVNDNSGAASTIQSGESGEAPVWDKGLHGEGQVIGVIDDGPLDVNHCFFTDAAPNTPGPAHRKVLAIRNATGSAPGGHATFVAGCAAGDDRSNPGGHQRRGGAWAARLVCGNNNDITGATTLLSELTAAMNSGAFIHTNSWHDNTAGRGNPATYNQNAADVDTFTFTNENHLVLGSAGNTGEEQGPPGTAKNAVCVAAAQAGGSAMNLGDGNPGPTADGRRKPDLVAVGCGIQSATVGTPCGTGPRSACATSYATPHAAAAAALVRQYFVEGWYPTGLKVPANSVTPSGSLLKAVLLNSTVDMTGVAGSPNQTEGWGLIRLARTLFFAGGRRRLTVWDVPHLVGLSSFETGTHEIEVQGEAEQLKVTLVWADPAPAPGAFATPVVNDLDLRVSAPDGTLYMGNSFGGGVSTANAPTSSSDSLNNVELVVANNPAAGRWRIEVQAFGVFVGNPGQGYAVVATATTKPSGCFVASAVYGDPDHPDVEALRAWRDRHLEPGARGRRPMAALDAAYRRVGPRASEVVTRSAGLRRLLRTRMLPTIAHSLRGQPWA